MFSQRLRCYLGDDRTWTERCEGSVITYYKPFPAMMSTEILQQSAAFDQSSGCGGGVECEEFHRSLLRNIPCNCDVNSSVG